MKNNSLKAYQIFVRNGDGYSAVVFAESAGKARSLAMHTDLCEDSSFLDIIAMRIPQLDSSYRDHPIMDWHEDEDRIDLVGLAGFCCEYPGEYENCNECAAKKYCQEKEAAEDDH